jgi:hypothetical protein
MTESGGLLGPAFRWSAIAVFASVVLWGCLATLDLAMWGMDAENVSRPLHMLITGALVTLTISALAVRLAAHIIRGQKAIMAQSAVEHAATMVAIAEVRGSVSDAVDAYIAGLRAPGVLPPQSEANLRLVSSPH